jgi:hypothetical protein
LVGLTTIFVLARASVGLASAIAAPARITADGEDNENITAVAAVVTNVRMDPPL